MTLTVTDQAAQLDNLRSLDNETFQTLVRNSLGKEAPKRLWELLADPTLARRTYTTLTTVYGDVCGQLSERATEWDLYRAECRQRPDGKQDWFDGLHEYKAWRLRALGYKRMLSARIAEIKQALPASAAAKAAARVGQSPAPPVAMNPEKKVRLMATIFDLGWAIREHRQRCDELGIEPEPHDIELWERLSMIRVQTDSGPIAVTKMLDDAAMKPDFVSPFEREAAQAQEPEADALPGSWGALSPAERKARPEAAQARAGAEESR